MVVLFYIWNPISILELLEQWTRLLPWPAWCDHTDVRRVALRIPDEGWKGTLVLPLGGPVSRSRIFTTLGLSESGSEFVSLWTCGDVHTSLVCYPTFFLYPWGGLESMTDPLECRNLWVTVPITGVIWWGWKCMEYRLITDSLGFLAWSPSYSYDLHRKKSGWNFQSPLPPHLPFEEKNFQKGLICLKIIIMEHISGINLLRKVLF